MKNNKNNTCACCGKHIDKSDTRAAWVTVTRWDLYNAITDYATHGESLSASMNIWMQNKAQKVLTTPLVVLAEAYQPVGGDAE